MRNVNIVGAGFVGLTLAEVLSNQRTVGKVSVLDVNKDRIEDLKKGLIPVVEKDLTLKSEKLRFISDIKDSDGSIFFVCVGTPNVDGVQNIEYLISAVDDIVAFNKRATIIIKSTTLPESLMEIQNHIDPLFTHLYTNPEFLAEGNAVADLRNQNQLVIGTDEKDTTVAEKLISNLFKATYKTVKVVGMKEAMIVKYFINSYKSMKLNFINDFNWYCHQNDFSFKQVIDAVNDPVMGEGFDKPGVAFGGSCFPKDTYAMGLNIPSCKVAHELNETRICAFIHTLNPLPGEIYLFGGRSFKSGTNDTRESVAVKVAKGIKDIQPTAHIYFYDALPELSDLTIDEIKEKKDAFDTVILFNNIPELSEVFADCDGTTVIDTREIK